MPASIEAGFGEALTRQIAAQHQSDGARDVSLEGQRHQVVHQTVMDMLALRQAEWDLSTGLFHGIAHRNLDPPLDFANVLGIGVEPCFITRTEIFLQKSQIMRDRLQDAGVLLSSGSSLLGACSVAEQPLESHTRIDLCRQRLRGCRPRDTVRVGAALSKVAAAEIAGVFNPKLKGQKYRVRTPLCGGKLTALGPKYGTPAIFCRRGAGENDAAAPSSARGSFPSGRG